MEKEQINGDETEAEQIGTIDRCSEDDLCYKQVSRWRRGKKAAFHEFVIRQPFQDARWHVKVLIAGTSYVDACRDVLLNAARQVGALESAIGHAETQVLQRLSRLEARIGGKGVLAGEAHNALRLFERELTRANWTRETFERLKRQLDGEESSQAADVVVETSVCWAHCGKQMRRTPWFVSACERIAAPLGLSMGHHNSGNGFDGCVFVGPLSTAVGAALTAALVFHLGHVEYECIQRARETSARQQSQVQTCLLDDDSDEDCNARLQQQARSSQCKATPKPISQFMQGFVDGAINEERAQIWQKMLTLPEAKAERFMRKQQNSGFFKDIREDMEESDESDDVSGLMSGIFHPGSAGDLSASSTRSAHPCFGAQPQSTSPAASSWKPHAASSSSERDESFALIVTANIQTLRRSLHRNEELSVKQYHWGRRALSDLQSRVHDSKSYDLGKAAGVKRSGEIQKVRSGASRGAAKRARALTNK